MVFEARRDGHLDHMQQFSSPVTLTSDLLDPKS